MAEAVSLRRRIQDDLERAFRAVHPDANAALSVAEPDRAWDYQANGAFQLAKLIRNRPDAIAAKLCEELGREAAGYRVETSGKGFLNISLEGEALGRSLAERLSAGRWFAAGPPEGIRRVVVDYSHPNVAKEMHVGHLRSTLIGDAIARAYEHLGVEVIRHNHIGDWGTPFGMLIEHLEDEGSEAVSGLSLGKLTEFYRGAREKFDADPDFQERARRRVVSLQAGDAATLALWTRLVEASRSYFDSVYDTLDVTLTPEAYRGESAYNDQLESVVEELDGKGLLVESDGAMVVFADEFKGKDGELVPLIVRKSDGGFGYAATDLAAVRYRAGELGADRILYVVGAPQALHLAMVFHVAREAGWLREGQAEHVAFGSVLSPDGKMLRTRAGKTIRMRDLIDDVLTAARERMTEGDTSDEDARRVAVGAIKFQDLSHQVNADYRFNLDEMLKFEGKTGPYLQYSVRRARAILAKAGTSADAIGAGAILVQESAEHELAVLLDRQDEELRFFQEKLSTSLFCDYLHRLAVGFSRFYEACPVLRAEGEARESRLRLTAAFEQTLVTGLGLLGISVPESM